MTNLITLAAAFIMNWEGYSEKPYLDTTGNWTVGAGLNISDPVVNKKVETLGVNNAFTNLIMEAESSCRTLVYNFDSLPLSVKLIAIDMRYNLGETKFRKFKKTIAALNKRDWKTAAAEIENSQYFKQTKRRARHHVTLLRLTGNP